MALIINNINETVKIDDIEDILKISTKKYYCKPLLGYLGKKKKSCVGSKNRSSAPHYSIVASHTLDFAFLSYSNAVPIWKSIGRVHSRFLGRATSLEVPASHNTTIGLFSRCSKK